MRKGGKKFFDLRVTLLFPPGIVEQRQSAADQREDEDAAFPQQHLVMTMKIRSALELQTIQQIELAQTKYQPPAGEGHCENDPQAHQGNYDSIALCLSAQSFSVPRPLGEVRVRVLADGSKAFTPALSQKPLIYLTNRQMIF